jgi:organic radical activating enzyme
MLEVTRRCNLKCAHCLNGDAENVDMPEDVFRKILNTFDEIYEIQFSGGEPLLVPDLMIKYSWLARAKGTRAIFSTTNGIRSVQEVENVIDQLKAMYGNNDHSHDGNFFKVSSDKYHTQYHKSWDDCDVANVMHSSTTVFARGNGKNIEGTQELDTRKFAATRTTTGDTISLDIEMLYVSADGNVFSDCNISYDDERELIATSEPFKDAWLGTLDNFRENVQRWYNDTFSSKRLQKINRY